MATNSTTLELILTAKDEATAKLQGAQRSLENMSGTLKKVGAVSTAVFATMGAVAVTAIKAYADAEAQTQITNQSLMNSFNDLSENALKKVQTQLKVTSGGLAELKGMAEKAGQAAVKLGFDDEAAARSFAKLFAVTKDTAQSQREVALAMDLARFKGISLEEATQKLVMVHSGATKELKALGIEVVEGATVMQNLDSITKQVTGSSEAYLKTTAGATEALKVNMDNLQETIGQALAPALNSVVAAITPIVSKVADWIMQHPELTKWIVIIVGALAGLLAVLSGLALILPVIITSFTILTGPIGLVILAIAALIAVTVLLVKNWDKIKAYFQALWADIVAIFKSSIDGIVGYFNNLIGVVDNVINKMRQVATSVGNTVMAPVNFATSLVTGKRALGGNVSGGSSYLVGENGPEIFSPGTTGFISPNGSRGGGGATFNININGAVFSRDAAQMLGNEIVNHFKLTSRIGL